MLVQRGDLIDGKYRIVREIGGGGMGVVYEAEHVDLGRCAVKLVLPEGLRHPDVYERFRREAKAARSLSSKHAVKVFDFGRLPSGVPYLVMELLAGEDLDTLLLDRGSLPVAQIVAFILQACDALAEAHDAGIVHRDLKPGNLFLARDHRGRPLVKVLDFGIAKVTSPAGRATGKEMTGDMRLGTLMYMSPEQLKRSTEVDARSDIWSIGVILYHLAAGKLPFEEETIWDTAEKIFKETPRPPSAVEAAIPAAFDAVVLRCLAKDPAQRYQTIDELTLALAPFATAGASGEAAADAELEALLDAPTRVIPRRPPAPAKDAAAVTLPALDGPPPSVVTERMAPSLPLHKAAPPATSPLLAAAPASSPHGVPLPRGSHPPISAPSPASAHTAPPWASTGAARPATRVPVLAILIASLFAGGALVAGWFYRGGSGADANPSGAVGPLKASAPSTAEPEPPAIGSIVVAPSAAVDPPPPATAAEPAPEPPPSAQPNASVPAVKASASASARPPVSAAPTVDPLDPLHIGNGRKMEKR